MKLFSISLSETSFSKKTAGFIPPNCVLHSVAVEDSHCTVCGTFFKDRKSGRIELYPEELLLESVDGVPILCIYMSKSPMVEIEGDLIFETVSGIFNFVTDNGLLKLSKLNFILQWLVPGLFFRNNDCLVDLPELLSGVPAGGFFQVLGQRALLQFLRAGFRLRLFPAGNVFRLELHFR